MTAAPNSDSVGQAWSDGYDAGENSTRLGWKLRYEAAEAELTRLRATLSDTIAQAYARGIEDAARVVGGAFPGDVPTNSQVDVIDCAQRAIRALKPKPQTLDTVDTGSDR